MTQSAPNPGLISSAPAGRGRIVGIVGLLTMVVAVAGYLREAALAARFGTSTSIDAYFSAIFIPNLLYLILIAGTLAPLLIPILLEKGAEEPARTSETFSNVATFVLLLMCSAVALSTATARFWLPLLFGGFSPQTLELAISLVYIIFPAVVFLAGAGMLTAVLNGFHKFNLAAVAPAVSSVIVITAVLLAHAPRAIYTVAIATGIGFLLQWLLLVPATRSLGIRYRLVLKLRDPAIHRLLRLGLPLFLYLSVANASSFLERNLASHLAPGAVSILTYALRLFTVPASFLAAPLATVVYPQFAREALHPNYGKLEEQLSRVFRLTIFLFLPITLWTMMNALPITRLLYERGQFSTADAILTSRVLTFYGMGILPNAVAIILLRCFFALQDTVTPLVTEVIDLLYYVAAATFAASRWGLPGLAVARGGAFFLVGGILTFVVSRKLRLLRFDSDFVRFVLRTLIASGVMLAVSWTSLRLTSPVFDSAHTPARFVIVMLLLATSAAAFLGTAALLRINEARDVARTVLSLMRPTMEQGAPE